MIYGRYARPMETLQERKRRIRRLEQRRAKRRGEAIWQTSMAGAYMPDLPTVLQMLRPRTVSFVRLLRLLR